MDELLLKPGTSKTGIYIIHGIDHLNPGAPHWHLMFQSQVWRPPTDVYETENEVVVRIEIAGMREDDFTIYLEGRSLQVRGMRADIPGRRSYHQMEIRHGEFSSEVTLPFDVNLENIEAVYSAGFLKINLPKIQNQHIPIQSNQD